MTEWLVHGLMPKGHIIMVAGQPGNGKSWWVSQLAVDTASDKLHFGEFDVEPCYVIYIDEDTPEDVYTNRLDRLAMAVGKKIEDLPIDRRPMKGFYLFDDTKREALADDIKKLKTKGESALVIIDCLVKVMGGRNLDTTERASKVMSYLTELRDAGATLVVVHHMSLKKHFDFEMWDVMGLVLDSTVLVSSADTAFTILQAPIKGSTIFAIRAERLRISLGASEPFAIELCEDKQKTWARLVIIEEIPKLPSGDAKFIFKYFPDENINRTVKELHEMLELDLSLNKIRDALKELVREECLKKEVDPHSRSHAAWYHRHPEFDLLTSFYKEALEE